MTLDLEADLEAIRSTEAVPTILKVVCLVTGMGFAAVARVTEDRWVCLAARDEIGFGLAPGSELEAETTLCHEVRQSREKIVIEDVDRDATYCSHQTPHLYGFRSYISVPIVLKDGSFYGTLCAIGPKPAQLIESGAVDMFQLFAEMIAGGLNTHERLFRTKTQLDESEAGSKLREQFIAVIGHDLRNPLASIMSGIRLVRRDPSGERTPTFLDLMEKSATRMEALIGNLLDFARGRLGGGLTLSPSDDPLEPILRHVVAELQIVHPDRQIDAHFDLATAAVGDRIRIGQMLSNLLANALTYGDGGPVVVRAVSGKNLTISVTNQGVPISPEKMQNLFKAFSRGVGDSRSGLGLGLYIASQIATAHGGTIAVDSSARGTTFTVVLPVA